jgi:hypothetical protein
VQVYFLARSRRRKQLWAPCFFLAVMVVVFSRYEAHDSIEIDFTIGTVIRGDEWTGEQTYQKEAVITSLKSFIRATGSPNRVMIFVDHESSCHDRPNFIKGCHCQSVDFCIDPVYGVPTMECIFDTLFTKANTKIVGFVNGDILVFDSFAKAVASSATSSDEFLMTGRRHRGESFQMNLDDFNSWKYAEIHAKTLPLDHGYAIDYFVTRKRTYNSALRQKLPPFVIGAWRWDNILMYSIYKFTSVTVIDVTLVAPVMHQYEKSSVLIDHHERRGARFNDELAKQISGNELLFGTIDFADVILEDFQLGQDLVSDPWHILARDALKAGMLTAAEIVKLKKFNDDKLAAFNDKLLSTEDHLSILREFRS